MMASNDFVHKYKLENKAPSNKKFIKSFVRLVWTMLVYIYEMDHLNLIYVLLIYNRQKEHIGFVIKKIFW